MFGFGWEVDDDDIIAVNVVIYDELVYFLVVFFRHEPSYIADASSFDNLTLDDNLKFFESTLNSWMEYKF
ncbi:MAG: hypothetical protein WA220_08350 [Candidatus Nitrosopolaris sp.]